MMMTSLGGDDTPVSIQDIKEGLSMGENGPFGTPVVPEAT
jgi:hypothetical protein